MDIQSRHRITAAGMLVPSKFAISGGRETLTAGEVENFRSSPAVRCRSWCRCIVVGARVARVQGLILVMLVLAQPSLSILVVFGGSDEAIITVALLLSSWATRRDMSSSRLHRSHDCHWWPILPAVHPVSPLRVGNRCCVFQRHFQ